MIKTLPLSNHTNRWHRGRTAGPRFGRNRCHQKCQFARPHWGGRSWCRRQLFWPFWAGICLCGLSECLGVTVWVRVKCEDCGTFILLTTLEGFRVCGSCTCVCACVVYVHVCSWISVCLAICLSVRRPVCLCACVVCARVCQYISVYTCKSVYTCVHICVFISLHV